MSLFGSRAEHGLHCLLALRAAEGSDAISSTSLAVFQGVSLSFVRKLLTDLERGGLVTANGGRSGGYRLARDAGDITVLDAVDVLEPEKRVFDCREIRQNCVLFESDAPAWVTKRPCEINAAFLTAETAMRSELAAVTLEDLVTRFSRKAPPAFQNKTLSWFRNPTRGAS